jgi:hypothetical protein
MGARATVSAMSLPAAPVEDPRPRPPQEPDAEECCGEGCVPCVMDRYDEAVARYRAALAAWQARHPEAADAV